MVSQRYVKCSTETLSLIHHCDVFFRARRRLEARLDRVNDTLAQTKATQLLSPTYPGSPVRDLTSGIRSLSPGLDSPLLSSTPHRSKDYKWGRESETTLHLDCLLFHQEVLFVVFPVLPTSFVFGCEYLEISSCCLWRCAERCKLEAQYISRCSLLSLIWFNLGKLLHTFIYALATKYIHILLYTILLWTGDTNLCSFQLDMWEAKFKKTCHDRYLCVCVCLRGYYASWGSGFLQKRA